MDIQTQVYLDSLDRHPAGGCSQGQRWARRVGHERVGATGQKTQTVA